MLKIYTKFNQWYDSLHEPYRFLFFMFAIMGWVPLLELGIMLPFAISWMLVAISIAATRIW